MNSETLMKMAIAGGMLFAAYKFGPQWLKGMALGVAGVAVAKRVPYLNEVV